MDVRRLFAIIGISLTVSIAIVVLAASGTFGSYGYNLTSGLKESTDRSEEYGSNEMTSPDMMSKVPKDVIIEFNSNPEIPVGKESEIQLLVTSKETGKPITDAQVIVGVERGMPMKSMEMVGGMFDADNLSNGTYSVKFTPDEPGIYTLHTHVVLSKSMQSMMKNHVDFGIIAE